MKINPQVSRIRIYPIKSLDPIELTEIATGHFCLLHDREFAMVTPDGRYVNGKRTGRVNQLQTEFDLANQQITLSERGSNARKTFELRTGNTDLLDYLSEFFGLEVSLRHATDGGLMDIPQSSSITVVSTASLESLQEDFPNHTLDDLRLRFRPNIELEGVPAFWEENLFGEPGIGVRFQVGDVEMVGISPRMRCNVPPRNPLTGETNKQFVRTMMDSRLRSLPAESKLPEHGGYYHLTVDTYLPQSQQGKIIRVGDSVNILESVEL